VNVAKIVKKEKPHSLLATAARRSIDPPAPQVLGGVSGSRFVIKPTALEGGRGGDKLDYKNTVH